MKKLILAIIASFALFAGTATMASPAAAYTITEGGVCVQASPYYGLPTLYWHKVFIFQSNGAPQLTWNGTQAFYWVCTSTP